MTEHTSPPVEQAPDAQEHPSQLADADVDVAAHAAPAPSVPQPPEPDIDRLLADAEQRGYLRGLNERAAQAMDTPRLWANPRRMAQEEQLAAEADDPDFGFLTHIRPGVWD